MDEAYFHRNVFRQYFGGVQGEGDTLWMENDWGDWIAVRVEPGGYVKRSLASGDGTTGYTEYQLYANEQEGYHYVLEATMLREPVAFEPEILFEERFRHAFFYADIYTGEKFELDRASWLDLFDTNPFRKLEGTLGVPVAEEQLRILPVSPGELEVSHGEGPDDAPVVLHYLWNGQSFLLSE